MRLDKSISLMQEIHDQYPLIDLLNETRKKINLLLPCGNKYFNPLGVVGGESQP